MGFPASEAFRVLAPEELFQRPFFVSRGHASCLAVASAGGSPAISPPAGWIEECVSLPRRKLPTKPHPANVASVRAWRKRIPPDQRIGDVRAFLRQRITELRFAIAHFSPYAWLGWDKLWRETTMRLDDAIRHRADCPIRKETLDKLDMVMREMRKQLDDSRPY